MDHSNEAQIDLSTYSDYGKVRFRRQPFRGLLHINYGDIAITIPMSCNGKYEPQLISNIITRLSATFFGLVVLVSFCIEYRLLPILSGNRRLPKSRIPCGMATTYTPCQYVVTLYAVYYKRKRHVFGQSDREVIRHIAQVHILAKPPPHLALYA